MNKAELITAMADAAGISKRAATDALNAFIENVEKTVTKGDSVSLVGFGTFSAKKRAARKGVNPQTGAQIKVAARTVPVFKAGKVFRDRVAKKKK